MTILTTEAAPAAPEAQAPAAEMPPAAPTPSTAAETAATLYDGQGTPPAAPEAETPPAETPPAEGEEKPKEGEEEKPDERYGAPEGDAGYADFTLPEGVELDAEGATELSAIAKELNLSQTSAQKLVDLALAKQARDAAASTAHIEGIRTGWQDATRADKEFGGDKLPASLAVAQKALKQFGTPELNELVVGAGLGDHPEFIRLMVRVGNAVSEAPIVNGGQSVAKDAASVLYPNHPRQKQ